MVSSIWKPYTYYVARNLTGREREWLLYAGSFTKKVAELQKSQECFSINVLHEGSELIDSQEMARGYFSCRYTYVREIQIYMGKMLLMYAKSVVPKNASGIFRHNFRNLAQKPLGHMLFSEPNITRSSFQLAQIRPDIKEFALANAGNIQIPSFLWARKSLFSGNEPLVLLTEVFSQQFMSLLHELD